MTPPLADAEIQCDGSPVSFSVESQTEGSDEKSTVKPVEHQEFPLERTFDTEDQEPTFQKLKILALSRRLQEADATINSIS